MYQIGICDDKEVHRQHIKKLCELYAQEFRQELQILEFSSGEAVLEFQDNCLSNNIKGEQEEKNKLHLLFLDIEMSGMNGIEVLQQVENAELVWRVVFVTNHEEMVWDCFGIKTLGFAKKPISYENLEKWLNIMVCENRENSVIEYMIGNKTNYVMLENIYYCKAERNYTYLYTEKERILTNDKLGIWQKKVENFPIIRIHKSFLVNMQHVKRWETNQVMLTNGVDLSIGRQYAKEAKDIYLSYVRKQAMKRI